MNEAIRKADTATLWAILSDVSALMEMRGYKPELSNEAFMFWYEIFKATETEINHRMSMDF